MALVLSSGTILVVDWLGLLWLLGKVEVNASGKLEAAARPFIRGGLALLLISGALIDPDLTSLVTVVKLASVLILMLNGLRIAPAMHRLVALPPRTRFTELTRRLRFRLMIALKALRRAASGPVRAKGHHRRVIGAAAPASSPRGNRSH